ELRVQQEELLQSNQELEENAQLLEEKNQFIEHKSKELLQLNNEVEVKNKDLELASKYKSEFLANMSHELRTPLNSILLLAKLLAESKELELGDDRYEYAKVIHSSGLGLLELINEILDLSKIEAGQMQIAIEEVGFKEIVTDMASMFNPLAKDKGLALLLDFDPALPQFIQSDKQRLEQVLKNLLSNAIKFTEQGSVNMHITNADNYIFAGGNTGKQTIAFSVKDTGIGIPADQQALVFEAFKQVDGSSRRKYGGTGLGLSISREITKLLGGELKLESEDGVGSTFTIYLPLAYEVAVQETEPVKSSQEETKEIFKQENIAEEVSKAENVEYELPEPQVQDDRDAITKSDKSILIVEDDIPFAKALSQFVKSSNYKVLVATRGDEGFAMAKKYQPAGVLLDINLPVMNGWSVLEHLKQDHATRHIPVHTMSSEEARQKSLSLGAIDFINKPLAEKELGNVLHRIEEISKKSSRSLLIIEEDKKNADALANYFREHNIHATAALSGNEGIQLLKAKSFDGVILDISVNEKMAFNVLDQIKMIAGYETLPVIVYTGHNITSEEEDKINKYAATSIVKKANTYEKLLSEVSIFLHIMDDGNDKIVKGKRANKLVERELEGKKILVADDDERNVYALTKALELQKVDVATASNGKQVMEYLENEPKIDAILIDIMMPEMDGYETIAALRQKYKYKNIPIIAVTAKTMPNDRNKCIEAGASDYISKPVDIDKLLSLLKVWLY
ncbi:MAG: response regulator, partial [Bacteroidia bacterium]